MPHSDSNDLMDQLQALRRQRRLTLREVAERGGFSNESQVSKIEQANANPTLRSMQRYAKALGVEFQLSVSSMKKVALFNYAGGSGKSSLTRDFGFMLTELGFKVLLIDLDPQHSLTTWLGVSDSEVSLEQTVYPVLETPNRDLPEPFRAHGMSVIPAAHALTRAEPLLMGLDYGVLRLRHALGRLGDEYDFVLIDSPPSLGKLTATAVSASDHVVVPVLAQSKGVEGMQVVLDMIAEWQQGVTALELRAFVPTMAEATSHSRGYVELVREQLSQFAPVLSPLTRRPAVYQEAQETRKPIGLLQGREYEAGIEDLRVAVGEFLDTMGVQVGVGGER